MPIPLGIMAVAGAGGAAAGAYELISTTIADGSTGTITFSSLPSGYKHLQVRATIRSSRSSNVDSLRVRLNGNTGSNYANHRLYGQGSSVASDNDLSQTSMLGGLISSNQKATGIFSAAVIDILDCFTANKKPVIRSFVGTQTAGVDYIQLTSGLFNSDAAVTSVTLFPTTGPNWVSGSRFSLYGIVG
jgi:hypothetical protein